MISAPEWWFWLSGAAFGLAILLFFVMLVLAFFLLSSVIELRKQIASIGSRVEMLAAQARELTLSVQIIAEKVGTQAAQTSSSIRRIAGKAERTVTGSALLSVGVGLLTHWLSRRGSVDKRS